MKTEMIIDGKKVPMNKFTQEIMGKVISSIAENLHGVDPAWEKIEIEVVREEQSK